MPDLENLDLQQLFATRIFRIPAYQRGYAWEEPQLQDLVDDIDDLGDNGHHYTGTIVLQRSDVPPLIDVLGDKHVSFDVVDGQQRLTTLILLLDAIRRETATDPDLVGLATGATRYLYVTDQSGSQLTKLQFGDSAKTQEYFQRAVIADQPSLGDPVTPAQHRLKAASAFLRSYVHQRVQAAGEDSNAWLQALHSKVTHGLSVNAYEVDDSAEAGVIFEVMNNRGRPLSDLDVVKNQLLYIGSKLHLDGANPLAGYVSSTWSTLFASLEAADLGSPRDENQLLYIHWVLRYGYPSKWDGRKALKERFSPRKYVGAHEQLLSELRTFVLTLADVAIAYCDIWRPVRDSAFRTFKDSQELRTRIVITSDCLVRLGHVAPFVPLLVATRLRFKHEPEKYLQVAELCELYAFRVYGLLEKRSHTGRPALARLARRLVQESISYDDMIGEFIAWLLEYSQESEFDDAWLMPAAKDGPDDWYHWGACKYFLFEYERHFDGQADLGLRWDPDKKADWKRTIEHILPQTPEDRYWTKRFKERERGYYMHSLGNLCLTENNSSYSNKAFPAKRGFAAPAPPHCYFNSNLWSERELGRFSDWGPREVLARREVIVAWARQRWAVPENLHALDLEPALNDEDFFEEPGTTGLDDWQSG